MNNHRPGRLARTLQQALAGVYDVMDGPQLRLTRELPIVAFRPVVQQRLPGA